MLTLNTMPHEPHGFSASMIATGREPTLPPDLSLNTNPSPTAEDPAAYVETIQKRLQLTHQQMSSTPTPPTVNPYQIASLIFALTTLPERTSKLAPRWKGPYRVCHIPNEYQVVYEDGDVERTIHINHAKSAKFTAPDFRNQCLLPKPHALLWDTYPRVSLADPLSPRSSCRLQCSTRPSSRSCRKHHVTACLRSSQSTARTCSSSLAISQAQSRARSHSCHKKRPCDPASPLFKPLQDGSHLPAHRRLQQMPRGGRQILCHLPASVSSTSAMDTASTLVPWDS